MRIEGAEGHYGSVDMPTELGGDPGYTGRAVHEKNSLLPVGSGAKTDGFFGPGARRTDNSKLMTVILVLNYMIGSGILNTPQTLRDSGLLASTALFIVACTAVWLGSVLLIRAAEANSSVESAIVKDGHEDPSVTFEDLQYASLARRTLGKGGDLVAELSIIVTSYGGICSYVVLVGGLTTSILAEWAGIDKRGDTCPFWCSFYAVAPLMVLMFVLPPCLVRHLSNLRWLAAFSLVAIASVVCLVMFGGTAYGAAERAVPGHNVGLDAPVVMVDWTGALAKLGSAVFALNCAPAALHAYSAMGERNPREWSAVLSWAVSLGGLLCYLTGVAGYLSFREATEGDILDNFTGVLASCFKVLVVVHLVFYIPHEVVVLRHSIFALTGNDVMEQSFCLVALATMGLLIFIVTFVMGLMSAGIAEGDLFGYILDLTGGVAGSLTAFVLPARTYLKATESTQYSNEVDAYRRGAHVLSVFGVLIVFFVPCAVVLGATRLR